MLMECERVSDSTAIAVYLLEYTGRDSAVVKYEISEDYVGALRVMAKNEMNY